LDPDDLDINFNLAEILEVLDDFKGNKFRYVSKRTNLFSSYMREIIVLPPRAGATKHYNKALSIDPDDAEIKERIANLKRYRKPPFSGIALWGQVTQKHESAPLTQKYHTIHVRKQQKKTPKRKAADA
jgi:hypothetical protein